MTLLDSAILLVLGGLMSAVASWVTSSRVHRFESQRRDKEFKFQSTQADDEFRRRISEVDHEVERRIEDDRRKSGIENAKRCLELLIQLEELFDVQRRDALIQGSLTANYEHRIPSAQIIQIKATAVLIEHAGTSEAVLNGLKVIPATGVMIELGHSRDHDDVAFASQQEVLDSMIQIVAGYIKGTTDESRITEMARLEVSAQNAWEDKFGR
ncbi:MAG: hypothetical protein ACOYBP_08640 [Microbacteriaceae bacterium]